MFLILEATGPKMRSWVMEEVLYMVVRLLTGKSVTLYQVVKQLVKLSVAPKHMGLGRLWMDDFELINRWLSVRSMSKKQD